jgi:hypothetical protein
VLEQDESLRAEKNKPTLEFIASNRIRVYSAGYPELGGRVIYLRGHNLDGDNSVCFRDFSSRTDRDEYLAKLLQAFKEFADNGYFAGKQSPYSAEEREDGIYEF